MCKVNINFALISFQRPETKSKVCGKMKAEWCQVRTSKSVEACCACILRGVRKFRGICVGTFVFVCLCLCI